MVFGIKVNGMFLLKVLLYAAAGYFLVVVLFALFQRHLIYFPEQVFPQPEEAGVPEMRVVELPTSDALTLRAWYRPPTSPELPTVVYFHGNAGHIGYRSIFAAPLLRQGYGVLLLTYRGYSGNPGIPSEEGFYRDGRAALDFLRGQGVSQECLVLYGNSIGTAVAVQMATERKVGALVLQSPFTSMVDLGRVHYRFLPVDWLLKDRFNSLSKASRVATPSLVLHGGKDWIIPKALSERLFEALPEPKEAHYIPDSGHNTLYEPGLVNAFIARYACGRNSIR